MVDEITIAGWGPPPARLSLEADEVHVWRGTVKASSAEAEAMLGVLSPAERHAADGHEPRRSFVAARFMLRSLLARYLDRDPADLEIEDDADGRPSLRGSHAGAPHWDFDWADTRAVFAISASQPIGMHVQAIPDEAEVDALAREMPAREAKLAEFLSPKNRARAVVGYRAEREALRRLAGGEPDAAGDWRVERLRLGKRFVAALAARGWDWSPSFWQYEPPPPASEGG
jgi:4'-phosphopantetheinyl transferase